MHPNDRDRSVSSAPYRDRDGLDGNSHHVVALCMAGRCRRFSAAGYELPKYLLPYAGSTVIEDIVSHLEATRLILVANERDRRYAGRIRDALGGHAYELLFTEDTAGQAATALIAADLCCSSGHHGPMFFHNVDTIIRGRDLSAMALKLTTAAGLIDVFRSNSEAYSYVQVVGESVVEIAEKRAITNLATSGLYGFGSPELFIHYARRTSAWSLGEFHISDVYRAMLARDEHIVVAYAPNCDDTTVLGTPEQYEAELRRDASNHSRDESRERL